jgi:hypothetical protein
VAEASGPWWWPEPPPWPLPGLVCQEPYRFGPRLVAAPSVAVGVLESVGDVDPVLFGVSLVGELLTGAWLAVGVGVAVGSWEAPLEAAEPLPDGVGPWHGLALLRYALSCGRPCRHVGLVVGVGLPDPLELVGVAVGVGVVVGVVLAEPVLGVTLGLTVAEPDLVLLALADGTVLAGFEQVDVGLGLAVVLVPPPWPGALPPPLIGWPVPAPDPPPLPPLPFTDVVLPVPDEPMFVIACRTPGTAAAVPAKMHTAARATTGRSQTMPGRDLSPGSDRAGRPATYRSAASTPDPASASRCLVCRP